MISRAAAAKLRTGPPGLEAEVVGPEETFEDLTPPRKPLEDVDRWERDVEEEPDPRSGESLADHCRDQLQLVVVHPYLALGPGRPSDRPGETIIHLLVGVPPVPMEFEGADGVVVEGPYRPAAEAVVVVLDL